jgi:hypothetical protein
VLKVEEWAEIRRLRFSERMGIKAIARHLGISKNTVRGAIRSTAPPRYERPKRPSAVDAIEGEIRKLLKDCPTMPATVIAERIGWERGITVLKERVAELRPCTCRRNRSSGRTTSRASWPSGTCGSRPSTSLSASARRHGCG